MPKQRTFVASTEGDRQGGGPPELASKEANEEAAQWLAEPHIALKSLQMLRP